MTDRKKRNNPFSYTEKDSSSPFSSEKQNGHTFPGLNEEQDRANSQDLSEQMFSLTDELDHEILMHRDAHFGGDFKVMLDYYQEEKIGTNPYFDLERITYLAELEQNLGRDLAPLILNSAELARVNRARTAYEKFKEIYLLDKEKTPLPRFIADLVLSEEESPQQEIKAIIEQGARIAPELLSIVQSDEAYDPLFPGYGYAPYFAIICLGKIGDSSAVIPLFETLEKEIAFDESIILEALSEIGEAAKVFLLKILKSRPLTKDNINAAFALTIFSDDVQVAITSFEQLQDPEARQTPLFRSYLLCNCEKLQTTKYREAFIQMTQDPAIPSEIQEEIAQIVRNWH